MQSSGPLGPGLKKKCTSNTPPFSMYPPQLSSSEPSPQSLTPSPRTPCGPVDTQWPFPHWNSLSLQGLSEGGMDTKGAGVDNHSYSEREEEGRRVEKQGESPRQLMSLKEHLTGYFIMSLI